MLFTTAARVLASLMVILATFRLGMGFYAAATDNQAFVTRYIGSGTSGDAIDSGFMVLAAGLALGVVTDISRSVRRKGE